MIHLKAILFGLALASPPVAAWVLRSDDSRPLDKGVATVSTLPVDPAGTKVTKIAVEVVANGSEPRWIQIEAPVQMIPEPGVLPLAGLAALLLLRRQRPAARD